MMGEALQLALGLLAIGMITVFLILFLVVLTGKILIIFINRYFPSEETGQAETISSRSLSIDPKILAAIIAVVEYLTGGKGKISDIERMD